MQRKELGSARGLLRKLDKINDKSRLDGVLPKAEQLGHAHFSALREAIWADIDVLAAEVWKREVGLQRYSVIRGARSNMTFCLQLLRFSLSDNFGDRGRWAWHLHGRVLRKNETFGLNSTSAAFRCADLHRRHLDGIWRELRWLND